MIRKNSDTSQGVNEYFIIINKPDGYMIFKFMLKNSGVFFWSGLKVCLNCADNPIIH